MKKYYDFSSKRAFNQNPETDNETGMFFLLTRIYDSQIISVFIFTLQS